MCRQHSDLESNQSLSCKIHHLAEIRMFRTLSFALCRLQIDDESAKHSHHAAMKAGSASGSGETHFKITIASSAFDGLSSLKRHRRIYSVSLAATEIPLACFPSCMHVCASSNCSCTRPMTWQRRHHHIPMVLQCLLHMPQILPKFRSFAILSAVRTANSNWGICSRHCNPAWVSNCNAHWFAWSMTVDMKQR